MKYGEGQDNWCQVFCFNFSEHYSMSNILHKDSSKVSYAQKSIVSKKLDNFAKITLRVTETGPSRISPVMRLVVPISGLTVKISRFSLDPTIAYIHQHLFKIYYFQFEHCHDTSQNIHAPYSCSCLFSLFLQPKYTAVVSFSWHYFPSSSLLCIISFSVSILI